MSETRDIPKGETATGEPPLFTIDVYIDNGVVFSYGGIRTPAKAREHASAIVKGGYRHNDGRGEFEHYPPHRIDKVKIIGVVPTKYPDAASGT